jgi:hypothetical protein
MKVENKVYNGYAFTKDMKEKGQINRAIYNEIKGKAEIKWISNSSGQTVYNVISNPENLTKDQLALICDSGNLCFGYRMFGNQITIYTD